MEKLTQDETALFEARKNLDEFEVEETGLIEQANKSKQKMSEIEKDYESVNRKIAEFERLRTDNIKAKSGKSLGSNLASLVTRLGAVTLAIFMMQILLSFYRFYVKVANHYEEQMILAENAKDPKSLESIISSISTAHINFGKEPEYPISKLAELSKFIK